MLDAQQSKIVLAGLIFVLSDKYDHMSIIKYSDIKQMDINVDLAGRTHFLKFHFERADKHAISR
jgi:hypothetical protein